MNQKIIAAANLQGFFFEGLLELNRKTSCPVPESILYYSSDVLDKFALSQRFFDEQEGRMREKILGMKLLEASRLAREEQKRAYKEVADMSLMICGYFSESLNKKIVDTHYYAQLGKTAYEHLDAIAPNFLDIPSFYRLFATSFEAMTTLMSMLASKNRAGVDNHLLFKNILTESVSEKDMLIGGVIPPISRKVS